jgi:hypothetical protein
MLETQGEACKEHQRIHSGTQTSHNDKERCQASPGLNLSLPRRNYCFNCSHGNDAECWSLLQEESERFHPFSTREVQTHYKETAIILHSLHLSNTPVCYIDEFKDLRVGSAQIQLDKAWAEWLDVQLATQAVPKHHSGTLTDWVRGPEGY